MKHAVNVALLDERMHGMRKLNVEKLGVDVEIHEVHLHLAQMALVLLLELFVLVLFLQSELVPARVTEQNWL